MSFIIDTTFTGSLPLAGGLAQSIIGSPDFAWWFQGDGNWTTGDPITAWSDKGGGARQLTAVGSAAATLEAAALSTFEAARFDSATPDTYLLTGSNPLWTGAFTIAAVAKLDDLASATRVILGANSGSTMFLGKTGTDNIRFRCGGTNNTDVTFDQNEWVTIIAAYDGTSATKLSVNGAAAVDGVGSDPAVVSSTYLGTVNSTATPWDGWISDCIVWDTNLFDIANAQTLADLRALFALYGLA